MSNKNIEIERKFLVKDATVVKGIEGVAMKQGYLSTVPDCTVRVRTAGDKAYITVKNKPTGLTRLEFEFAIPISDAEQMLATVCTGVIIHKTRYTIIHQGKEWIVDQFHSPAIDVLLAEIELESEDEAFAIPDWAGTEVTGNPAYSNSNISRGSLG